MGLTPRRVALKVDCDTFEGTKNGLPNLIRLFDELKIRATFLFTLGPDTSGRAVFRVFTQKGFLKKMLRSNAAALYGPKTMMYGTLLPSPMIGKQLGDDMRAVKNAGHEVGVHGWDHIRWHDKADKISPTEMWKKIICAPSARNSNASLENPRTARARPVGMRGRTRCKSKKTANCCTPPTRAAERRALRSVRRKNV